jgi:signal transduction histidine kinase
MTATHDQLPSVVTDDFPLLPTELTRPARPETRANGARPHRAIGLVLLAVALGSIYALGALLPFWYLSSPAPGVVFFPSAGLTLATLLLSPRRLWPLWLSAFFVAEFAVDVTHSQTAWMALGFAVANTIEPFVGAYLLQLHHSHARPNTLRARTLAFVVIGVVMAPIVGSVIGATTAVLAGSAHSWGTVMWHWWLGDALGVIVVATPILAWARPSPYDKRPSIISVVLFSVLATSVMLVPAVVWGRPMLYAVMAVLIWAAFAGGTPGASTAGLFVAFAVDWAAITGRAADLVPGAPPSSVLVYVQSVLAVTLLVVLTLAVAVADRVRAERHVARAEAERNRAERQVVTAAEDERRRIARETHDIVGHALNVMLLQAGAARRLIDRDAAKTRSLLESIETEGREAFRDLDIALGLDGRGHDKDPIRGLAGLPDLVARMQHAGMQVTFEITGEPTNVSTLLDWSAYRIVQEALTNVAKHAAGARAKITLAYAPDVVTITVTDDGGATAGSTSRGGHGLVGMRERVAVLGGEITLGPQPTGGFSVRACLPIRGSKS